MSGIAEGRLKSERKEWRKNHPFRFIAKPKKKPDGSTDIFEWKCGIPGKEGTPWEGATYRLTLKFTKDYPSVPPKCKFDHPVFHPNIFTSGDICLSILKPHHKNGWKSSITIPQILTAIQTLLTDHNVDDPANSTAAALVKKSKKEYDAKIRAQAIKYGASAEVVL